MHSAKPRSKNHFPGCVQSPYSLRAVNSSADPPSAEFPNSLGLPWVLVRFEPLNPLTPDPDFGNLFLCFLASYWEIPILVSVIPASYWGNSSVQGLFCRQTIGDIPFRRSCCCDKLLGNSYPRSGCWGIPLWKVLKVSVYLFFESLQHSGS